MNAKTLKRTLKALTPPILWNVARSVRVAIDGRPDRAARAKLLDVDQPEPLGAERTADWYDANLSHATHFLRHYTETPYYFLWSVIADRLKKRPPSTILEVACGTGQLARCLDEVGAMRNYCGFDFAVMRVQEARRRASHLRFEVADVFTTDLFGTVEYDVCLTTEFLEHVEADFAVLERIPPGVHVIASVPNYPAPAHVRKFADENEVMARYGRFFSDLRVDRFIMNKAGLIIFLMEGDRI